MNNAALLMVRFEWKNGARSTTTMWRIFRTILQSVIRGQTFHAESCRLKWGWFQDCRKSVTFYLLSGWSHIITANRIQMKLFSKNQTKASSVRGRNVPTNNSKLLRISMKEQQAPLLCRWLHEVPSSDGVLIAEASNSTHQHEYDFKKPIHTS